tara:strand:+ start:152 stop:1978 length:1827 start_codon:yes stop_codon:yes gene_type:complete
MCGIFGTIGDDAAMRTLEGLRRLEYRGYDSAGLAALFDTSDKEARVETERAVGYVSDLVSKVNGRFKNSVIAIGHTRWATHGGVTEVNAHPHSSADGLMSVVHNGIIENTSELLSEINESGYSMTSETDTELIVHLLHEALGEQRTPEAALEAFQTVIGRLEGAWAIAVIVSGMDGILVAKNGAPLVIGRCENCISISSDPLPLYGSCSEVAYLDDGDIAYVSQQKVDVISESADLTFAPHQGDYSPEDPGIFAHMMIKEIHDQPTAFQNAIAGRVSADGTNAMLSGFELDSRELRKLDRINLVACGTAFFAAKLGVRYIRRLSDVPVEAYLSSEFPVESVGGKNTLTIAVTQSGETKDTLDALTRAKVAGGHVSSICNVIDSTIARFAGNGAYLYAGPEYSVASTKAFTNMSAVLMLLALTLSETDNVERARVIRGLREMPQRMSNYLHSEIDFESIVDLLVDSKTALFIGRGPNSHIASEAALKMMEIAYLPCIAYPGGELKHGPIALIEEGTPVIAIAPDDSHYPKMEANIRECASRGANVILVTNRETSVEDYCARVIRTPPTDPFLSPFMSIMPLHLLAYHLAVRLGRNVDRPRNLAKSVTVV